MILLTLEDLARTPLIIFQGKTKRIKKSLRKKMTDSLTMAHLIKRTGQLQNTELYSYGRNLPRNFVHLERSYESGAPLTFRRPQ